MPPSRPPSHFSFALALSLALHIGLLLPGILPRKNAAPAKAPLQAVLRVPQPLETPPPAEAMLKNTLDSDVKTPPSETPLPARPENEAAENPAKRAPKSAKPEAKPDTKREIRAAQKKLSQHLYYPPEAVARGIEGEVRVLIALDDTGVIVDVQIAASSGHALLDNAALKAAWSMSRIANTPTRQLLLPVIFRLQ